MAKHEMKLKIVKIVLVTNNEESIMCNLCETEPE